MKILRELIPICPKENVGLTIGNFDGVHLGHQTLLNKLKSENDHAVVVSFSNHPSTVLSSVPKDSITTLEQKIHLFEALKIDFLYLIPFDSQIKEMPASVFLLKLQQLCRFTKLYLGYDAKLGRGREGTSHVVQEIGKKNHFLPFYIPPVLKRNCPISSSRIRQLIKERSFEELKLLLNRPYSIYMRGNSMKFHQFCLPPDGIYSVCFKDKEKKWKGEVKIEDSTLKILSPSFFHEKSIEVIFD